MIIVLLLVFILKNFDSLVDNNIICNIDNDISKYVSDGRLPHIIVPERYAINYEFDEDLKSYMGKVFIDVLILNRTDIIILHSIRNSIVYISIIVGKNLSIKKQYLVSIKVICFIPEKQFMVIKLQEYLEAYYEVSIYIRFKGNISDDYRGIYSFDNPIQKSHKKKIVSTFFEPTYARMAFPCFDEPSFKAPFNLELIYPKSYTVISNTKFLSNGRIDEKMREVVFKETPIMSTYLFGFTLFDFKNVTITTKSGVDISVWLPEEYISKAKLALKYASKIFDYINDFFDIPYSLEKLDIVGMLPFARYTGTEHFGFISISTISLMIDENESSIADKQQSFKAIGHLITHQWLGNLVTMKWWNDLWLKEGFATFLSFLSIYENFPNSNICCVMEYEILSYMIPIDQTKVAHPLVLPSNFKRAIQELYDHIPYYKGNVVLNAIYFTIGLEKLKKCIRKYLKRHIFSTATSEDFLEILKKVAGIELYEMIKILLYNPGIPVISVEKLDKPGTFKITQDRFLISWETDERNFEKYQGWIIPINYTAPSIFGSSEWFLLKKKSYEITLPGDDKWINVNYNWNSYFRTEYKSGILSEITEVLKRDINAFLNIDRSLLVSDAFEMVSLGKQPIKYAFDHFEYLRKEKDVYTMTIFFDKMEFIKKLVYNHEDTYDIFRKYVLGFSLQLFNISEINYLKNDYEKQLHILGIAKSISFDDQKIIDKGSEIFSLFLQKRLKIDSSLLPHYGCSYIKKYGYRAFEEILNIFLISNSSATAEIYLRSLLCSNDPNMLEILLEHCLLGIRPKYEIPYIVVSVSQTPVGAPTALNFIINNIDQLGEIVGENISEYVRHIPTFMSSYKTTQDLITIQNLFKRFDTSSVQTAIDVGVELVKQNMFWIEKNLEDLKIYLSRI